MLHYPATKQIEHVIGSLDMCNSAYQQTVLQEIFVHKTSSFTICQGGSFSFSNILATDGFHMSIFLVLQLQTPTDERDFRNLFIMRKSQFYSYYATFQVTLKKYSKAGFRNCSWQRWYYQGDVIIVEQIILPL